MGLYNVQSGSYIPTSAMSDSVPMTDDSSKVVTAHAAYTVDSQLLALINGKTAVRFWDAGTFKNGTPATGDMIIFTDNTTIAGGSGIATFYLTSDHTSGGTALCSAVIANSVRGSWTDDQGNYNPGVTTVDGALKYVTVKTTKQSANGLVLLSTTVLGSITYPSAPNGTTVTLFAIGIAA